MTEAELRAEAKKLGYVLVKKPCYQCTCYVPYPNKSHRYKNGRWKCVDEYRPIKFEHKGHQPLTRCQKINREVEE